MSNYLIINDFADVYQNDFFFIKFQHNQIGFKLSGLTVNVEHEPNKFLV